MSETDLGTYQMLWDCPYCGSAKLLGKTHRHCPACGAAQDPERRYFPSDEDKVTVEDHEFTGADRKCPACSTPMAAAATHCAGCGSAMDGSAAVETRADQVHASGTAAAGESVQDAVDEMRASAAAAEEGPPEPPPKKKKSKVGCVIGCVVLALVLAVIAVVLVVVLWKRESSIQVAGHTWERTIEVEEYRSVKDEDWCDEMPSAAHDVTRSKEVRSHKKVADGEDCSVRRKDQGDGTFKEVEECKTRYREEPVYDQKCKYTVERWKHDRTAKETGLSLADSPSWPSVKLSKTGTCIGCEREGSRDERYTVHFASDEGEDLECDLPLSSWSGYETGSRWTGKVGVVTGKLDCDSLAPAG